jgi:RmlD substrate binding domain
MPLHYGKIFTIIVLLTIVAFVLWQLWIGLFAGETFDEKAIARHAEAPKALASQEPWAVRSRIMVFGAGGQVGRHLIEVATGTGRGMVGLTHLNVDICNASAVTAPVAERAPSSIVNAAANQSSTRPKANRTADLRSTETAPRGRQGRSASDVPLVHVSTDCVFDGSSQVPYAEDDRVNPQGI